ncbi:MAG TPA: ATP-binding protein, partial [Tepidisphaeraceae bacterium]|nr:ATP-binding protein [Tepidisphaeraceae bacterium]
HDLRTPLAAITGAASSLIETGDKLPPPARAELIDLIYSQAQRMERQVNNLLEMTRLESGELKLNCEPQPLQGALGSALRLLEHRLEGRQVITSIPSDLPLVKVDDVAIEQVLTNLIDNALQYTPLESPIEIAARVSGEQVIVEISDRGPGLPLGAEHRIFEKFFRAGMSGNQPNRGAGLGLAICRGIVNAHGGSISASNREGGGAVFQFTLPIADAVQMMTA